MSLFNDDDPKYRCCFQCMHVRTGTVVIAVAHAVVYSLAFSHCVKVASTIFNEPKATASTDPPIKADSLDSIEIAMGYNNSANFGDLNSNHSTDNGTAAILGPRLYRAGFSNVIPSLSLSMLLLASIVALSCIILALVKTKPIFVIPEIILILANGVTFFLMIIFCVIALAVDSSELNVYIRRQLQTDQSLRDLPETTEFLARLAAGSGIALFSVGIIVELAFLRIVKIFFTHLNDKRNFLDDHETEVRYFAIDEHDGDGDDAIPTVAIISDKNSRQGAQRILA